MTGASAQKSRPRWETASRPADHALLVRDPGPMVIRNDEGRRALRRRDDGLSPAPAARLPLY
jgi:hypothetical protein